MVWPQYALLTTSLVLCFWMPDTLYQTIVQCGERHRWRVLMTMNFKTIANGEAVAIGTAFPISRFDDFRTQAMKIVSGGGKVVQFFAFQKTGRRVKLAGRFAHRPNCWWPAAMRRRPIPP
jgi:hypothetical protein